MAFSLANIALRAVPGAYIASSGVDKLSLDEQSAAYLQQMAVKGVPAFGSLDAKTFGKVLAVSELAVGGALLAPFIPNRLAGLVLGGFSAGMISMYLNTPEFTREDGIRPTQEGTPISHNFFLAAIAGGLILQGKNKKKAKKK